MTKLYNLLRIVCIVLTAGAMPCEGSAHAQQCGLPPFHWCDTAEVAARCGVSRQCAPWLMPPSVAPPVVVALYYESLCPGCQDFIAGQLYDTWLALRSSPGVLNVTLVPYGNAKETWDAAAQRWNFTCQHGEEECRGNLVEVCAIHLYPDSARHLPFIHCMENMSGDPMQQAPPCAKKHGMDYQQVVRCANGTLGNRLMHANAVKTGALKPKHKFVPWVTLQGAHTDEIQKEAEKDLLALVCKTYTGRVKPAVCKKKGHGKGWPRHVACRH